MDKQKLDYFRKLLLQQRRQAIEALRAKRAIALEDIDGVDDSGEMLTSGTRNQIRIGPLLAMSLTSRDC